MGKFKTIRFKHNEHLNVIRGKVLKGSLADYLMLVRKIIPMTDEYVIERFKNGKQLVFNTKFIQSIKERHGELHCELCGKENLVLYYWWQDNNRTDMATADHFFPKSLDKERLSFEKRNIVVACDGCNSKKKAQVQDINSVKHPYPETIKNLKELKKNLEL